MTETINETIKISDHVRSMIDPDGAVLLDLERGKYFSLNTVGAEIWKQCEQGADRDAILRHLESTFRAPAQRLQQDFQHFVQTLSQKGLLHVTR